VRNHQKIERRNQRLSHDALFNAYRLALSVPKFIRKFDLVPRLLLYILDENLKDQFEEITSLAKDSPVQILYDTTFNLGDFYVSPLIFRHSFFIGDKIVPLAFFIHDSKYQFDHEQFFAFLQKEIPSLKTSNVVFITDREFDVQKFIPNASQLFCWNHLIKNVERWLISNGADAQQRQAYLSDMYKLLKQPSEEMFFETKSILCDTWNPDFLTYFEKQIQSAVINHAGRWVIDRYGIYSPTEGITSNAAESFNNILKTWQDWREMPLDCLVLQLHYLCKFYAREVDRGLHGQGDFLLKTDFRPKDIFYLSTHEAIVQPEKILEFVRDEKLVQNTFITESSQNENVPSDPYLSVKAQARQYVKTKQVSLDSNFHVFLVRAEKESDPPYCVALSPQKCSCKSTTMCAHILAVRMLIGLETQIKPKKPNMAHYCRVNMKFTSNRKSGRKASRRLPKDKRSKIDTSIASGKLAEDISCQDMTSEGGTEFIIISFQFSQQHRTDHFSID